MHQHNDESLLTLLQLLNIVAKVKHGSPVLVGELISWRMLLPDRLVDLPISRWGSKISRYLDTMRTEMK